MMGLKHETREGTITLDCLVSDAAGAVKRRALCSIRGEAG